MVYVFISYSHHDEEFVERLRSDIVGAGFEVWRDRENIRLGVNWDTSIERVLRSGQVTHVFFAQSEHSIVSDIVANELSEAFRCGIRHLVPLLLDDSLTPLIINRRNPVDFRLGYDQALQKLISELTLYERVDRPNRVILEPTGIIARTPTTNQTYAAHDTRPQVRLIAGPGTGKSFVIEERVRWLLSNNISPQSIFVVSFTRAASADLRKRIIEYCFSHNQTNVHGVNVSTLHSLALRALRKSNALAMYPVDPLVLDDWELKEIFDSEFKFECGSLFSQHKGKAVRNRAEEIRLFFEARWSTGEVSPSEYMMPEIPLSDEEKASFERFHGLLTRVYSCVLPGEIVAKCVEQIDAGSLDPTPLLGAKHLIVDEFQDLNSADVQFIDAMATLSEPAQIYVLGDDDQSIYSFRHAYPTGIQTFHERYPSLGNHTLDECFRCTPNILNTATSLIARHSPPQRLSKHLFSHHSQIAGVVHRLKFRSEIQEAQFIARSCQKLIEQGVDPSKILILISSRDTQLDAIVKAFNGIEGIRIKLPSEERYISTTQGRYIYALIRVACDLGLQDYVAHRLVFGLPTGIGESTCSNVKNKVIGHSLGYLKIFYNPLPANVFTTVELRAINRAREVFAELRHWGEEDTLADRRDAIARIVSEAFRSETHSSSWYEFIAPLPDEMSLRELKSYLSASNEEQRMQALTDTYNRLELELEAQPVVPKVQIMTMHGAKGLNAQVVFVPGLEDEIIPSQRRRAYTGLVLEAARLLYVSITRASAACILSFTTSRSLAGKRGFGRNGSMFNTSLGGRFVDRNDDMTDAEVQQIVETIVRLQTT